MTTEKIIPNLQILLCFLAMIVYLIRGDWHRAAYWFFAGGIAAVVTY